jgi:Ca2+/Na+ antiporter
MDIIQPFDLQTLFVNVFSGNMFIFAIVAMLVIAVMAAKFRMSNLNAGLVFMVFAAIMATWITWLATLIALIAGFIIYSILGRIVKT